MEKIGKYDILEVLGKGGMGVVYKAFDPLLQREVAIKVLSESAFENPEMKERFFREARSAAQLSHENITIVHDLGEAGGKPYIVMEYLTGTDLRSLLKAVVEKKKEPLSLRQKLDYTKQICKGLEYSHVKGVVHRDVKPENIRILHDGKVKIMDFGIAKLMANTMTQTGLRMGTPGYMSPEQIKSEKVDHRSDIFSFGILLYELLTYKMPFRGDNITAVWYKIVHENPEPLRDIEIENLYPLRDILLKALKKNANQRYQSFSEVAPDLEAIIQLRDAEEKRRLEEQKKKEERKKIVDEKLSAARNLLNENQYEKAMKILEALRQIVPEQTETLRLLEEAKAGARIWEQKRKSERSLGQARDYLEKKKAVEATGQPRASAPEAKNPSRSKIAEAKLVDAKAAVTEAFVPKKKRPKSKTRSPKRKKIYLLAAPLILAMGAVIGYRSFIDAPSLQMGYVSLHILPWAEITKIESGKGEEIKDRYIANGKMMTPCRLTLPEGNYNIHLTNPAFKDPLIVSIAVKKGEVREVKQKMPGFDYSRFLSNF